MTTKKHSWSEAQVRMFVREVRKDVGEAWDWMVPRVRQALIAEHAFQIVRLNHKTPTTDEMNALLYDMFAEAGLKDAE